MSNKIFNFSMFIITLIFFIVMICYSISFPSNSHTNSDTTIDTSSDIICDNSYVDITSFTKIYGNIISVYVHNYTGVCYVCDYNGFFSPLYNSDGTLLIYSN